MDTLQCAVVLAKLERFEWEIARRGEVARRYDRLLSELSPELQLLRLRPGRTSAHAQYTVIAARRGHLQEALKRAGVPTAVHYPEPLHRQPAYEGRCRAAGDLAHADAVAERVLSLPMHPYLAAAAQDAIVAAVRDALR
jgi:UDP-2-acetamido-2-deoxy-ribo-hexuluronate aminotransferase